MQVKLILIVIISTLIYLAESSHSHEVTVRGAARLERATPNEFSAIIEQMSSVARIVSAVSLQNGLIDKTIPPNKALAELLNIGAVDVEKLQTFNKKNVRSALSALDQLQPRLKSTPEGDKLEAMIILLDSWRRKHEKVGDVKDIKLAKEYYVAVGEAQGKTLKDVFTQDTVSSFQSVISALEQISTIIKKDPVNEKEFKKRLNSIIDNFSDVESFSIGFSDFMTSLRQFDDLSRRDFVVDSPQRHYIDLLNDIEASKSSIGGRSSAAETQIANTANKVHMDFSEAACTDLFHLAEIILSQSQDGHKMRKYTSGLPNGYQDLEKLDGDVNNPAMKPLLGTFSPSDLQNGLGPLKTLTKDAIELHQAWRLLNKSEGGSANEKQLVSLTRWFGALKSPITSATVSAAASFGEKYVPSVSFSSNFAESIEKSIKLRSTLLNVRHKAKRVQNSPFMGNLTLFSELKKILPNSTLEDVKDVPQLVETFKKFTGAQNLTEALIVTKPMIEDIYYDLVNVNITQTIMDISGGQNVFDDFVGHSDVGAVNNYLTELANSGIKSVAETVQLVQHIRAYSKNATFDKQLLKMSDAISSSIPKVKNLTSRVETIVNDKNPDSMKLKELKISGKESKVFADSVMLMINVQKFLEKETDFDRFISLAELVDIMLPSVKNDVVRNALQERWGDLQKTNKTGKFLLADMKTRKNVMKISSISSFADLNHFIIPFEGIQDLDLNLKNRVFVMKQFLNQTTYMAEAITILEELDSINLLFETSSASLTLLPQTLANLDQAFNFVAQQQTLVNPTPVAKSTSKPNANAASIETMSTTSPSSNMATIIILIVVVLVIAAAAIGYGVWRWHNKKEKKSEQNRGSGESESKVGDGDGTIERNGSGESAGQPVSNEVVKSNESKMSKESDEMVAARKSMSKSPV